MSEFQNPDDTNIEYGKNGSSNTYRLNGPVDLDAEENVRAPGEYITIYNPHGSFKSKALSVTMIVSLLLLCWLVFKFIYQDRSSDSATLQAQAVVQANRK